MEKLQTTFIECQQNQSNSSFKKLYLLTSPRLFAVLLRILKDSNLAQDSLQEVFMKIWQKMDTYNINHGKAIAWMSTIARNHALDKLRKKTIVTNDEIEKIADTVKTHEENIISLESNSTLTQCLKQLKPEQHQTIMMIYFDGLTYQKISELLQKPESTIKTWVRRSLPILKTCLEQTDE